MRFLRGGDQASLEPNETRDARRVPAPGRDRPLALLRLHPRCGARGCPVPGSRLFKRKRSPAPEEPERTAKRKLSEGASAAWAYSLPSISH